MRFRPGVCLLLCLTAFSLLAQTKAQQGDCPFNLDLVMPPEITTQGTGEINTTFTAVLKPGVKVPVWTNNGTAWTCAMQPYDLRNYTFPGDNRAQLFPGPTLRLRKPAKAGDLGDGIKILLVNNLPWAPTDDCNKPCDCATTPTLQCCKAKDTAPNCFHGNNTTNLHFHGTHVSPQAPQDYVLLELNPNPPPNTPPPAAGHVHEGIVAYGSYQYAVDKLRYEQPEGTHWYHPHKHGSTALQVANGMAGALIIEGPFDDWLKGWYASKGANLDERILVLQQIHDLNFTSSAPVFAPLPLVNGQAQPVVHMYPGQVQRWRFVAATMEASAQLKIDFNGPLNDAVAAKQIAFDGIQFAPENYGRQPLLDAKDEFFRLSPGNRADFLVQAPTQPGRYAITYDVFGRIDQQLPKVRSEHEHHQIQRRTEREQVREMLKAVGGASGQPGLLLLEVDPCTGTCPAMGFPAQSDWPQMPPYLAPIETVDKSVSLVFQLLDANGNPGALATQPTYFKLKINNDPSKQYNPQCVDFSPPLNSTEEWTLTQNVDDTIQNAPFHVFHIHTNPFQIRQAGTTELPKPWVWADSITLQDVDKGKVVIRQRFEQFTGQYVLHCHFLGHEDRGMMLGVQTVCPGKPDSFGHAVQTGEECVTGNYFPAADRCNPKAPTTTHKKAIAKKKS
jgi:FtsP/CotA-like multicopper oxidase with cupredoxin domain